jgi:glycosyltransferase involved in cell wall biosynthesis
MRVLAISYFFPPIGGAGVQRNLRLASHLSERGVEMVVLTGPAEVSSLWTPHDERLGSELPSEVELHRIAGPEPSVSPMRGRLERILRIDSDWARWWRRGVVAEGRHVGRGCDLIWALMQPYASARPVAELASELNVPWVADLADPWALDEMQIYPSSLHRRLELREMRNALLSSAAIVMSTREAARQLVGSFPELRSHRLAIGPVGWDRDDFRAPPPQRSGTRPFRIVHTGYLHTELGRKQRRLARVRKLLGGTRNDVEILTRSHVFLLRAIDALLEQRPELRGRIEFDLAGVQSAADHEVTSERFVVRMLGYLEHPASVALIRSADLLFLPMHDLPLEHRSTIVPGKTYEYLAAGRPILAAVPNGDARDILAEAGGAFLCQPSDEEAMAEIVSNRLDAFIAGKAEPAPNREVVERFEYGRLASEMAAFFGEIVR